MHGDISLASANKREVAKRLLRENVDNLEFTTKRIRAICERDLQNVAATGILSAGSILHGILVTVSRDLRLDACELESLNSMIKSI